MVLNLPLKGHNKYLFILNVLAIGHQPFKKLRPREREVLSWLYWCNYENVDIPKEHRSKIVFHKDSRRKMSVALNMSMDNIYNVLVILKKQGLVTPSEDGLEFNSKYASMFEKTLDTLTFKFNA